MSRPDNPSSFSITGGEGLDVVADHLLGATEVAGLGNADAVDMQLPSVLPALGAHGVGGHWSHPSGRQANFLMVSRTTPGETMRDRTTTATCSPQGQYHFWWSPMPAWG